MPIAKEKLDFIVIGAQKAGTTSLFEYMRQHPQLELPGAKEVPYFSHQHRYQGSWSDYLAKAFAFADPECSWGTVTPHYMVGGLYERGGSADAGDERTVPLRIRERLPDVRLIAILRDPVERARSHYEMAVMNGWEERCFGDAVDELLRPEALQAARRSPSETTGYIVWGEYGRILSGYREVFREEQLLVLYTSDLRDQPAIVLQRVFDHLAVAADFVPENLGTSYRESGAARRMRWLDLNPVQSAAAHNAVSRGLWHALPVMTRRRIDRRFSRAKYSLDLWNRRNGPSPADKEPTDQFSLRRLHEHFCDDRARLAELLGATPPWTTA